MQKKRLTTKHSTIKNHAVHIMKRQSTAVENIVVRGFSVNKLQHRTVITFACECREEEVFYRSSDQGDLLFAEYSKPVKK